MAEADQIAEVGTEKKMSAEQALEFALLFSILGAHGAKEGGSEAYRNALTRTFTEMLDGFGYQITPKE